jgi:CRISPR/Cas system CMR subunit Cmr6 (Cas7 group RAMP superfamily)
MGTLFCRVNVNRMADERNTQEGSLEIHRVTSSESTFLTPFLVDLATVLSLCVDPEDAIPTQEVRDSFDKVQGNLRAGDSQYFEYMQNRKQLLNYLEMRTKALRTKWVGSSATGQ